MYESFMHREPSRRSETNDTERVVELFLALAPALRALQPEDGDKHWRGLDLSMPQMKALMVVLHTGGVPARRLAERMDVGPSAVTALVDKLVEHDMVKREPDPDDRRVTWIRPTTRAQQLQEKLLQTNAAALRRALGRVAARDLGKVHEAFAILLDAARAAADGRPASSKDSKDGSRDGHKEGSR